MLFGVILRTLIGGFLPICGILQTLSTIFLPVLNVSQILLHYLIPSRYCSDGWGCRIGWLLLCRGVRHPPSKLVSKIWHWTIWWWGSTNAGALGNEDTSSLSLPPDLLWPEVVAPDKLLSMSQIELNCVLLRNRIVFDIETTYTKLNHLK